MPRLINTKKYLFPAITIFVILKYFADTLQLSTILIGGRIFLVSDNEKITKPFGSLNEQT